MRLATIDNIYASVQKARGDTSGLPESGLRKGDIGAVVHVHGDSALEVEFVRDSGRTQALVRLAATDVRPVQDEDVPAVRTGAASEWERQNVDFRHYTFRHRVLDPLVQFALLEQRVLPTEDRWKESTEFRVTPLFDRFMRFEFERQTAHGRRTGRS